MVKRRFTINRNEPLVFQVGHLGEAYDEWVHQPIISKETLRFFGNNFLEYLFTRTVWWVIPLVWLPVIWWFVSISVQRASFINIWRHLHLDLGGVHCSPLPFPHENQNHHKHPMDRLRLVYPSAATTILCVPVWTLNRVLSTPSTAPALFGGGLLGYVIYDITHYYLHHGKPSKGLIPSLWVSYSGGFASKVVSGDHRNRCSTDCQSYQWAGLKSSSLVIRCVL